MDWPCKGISCDPLPAVKSANDPSAGPPVRVTLHRQSKKRDLLSRDRPSFNVRDVDGPTVKFADKISMYAYKL